MWDACTSFNDIITTVSMEPAFEAVFEGSVNGAGGPLRHCTADL